ncbi:MAG: low temperature requirement protein A [Acidimicrobiia bacterium]|nr:low temperature requirement protein A [Acidimicrobiia bacterium]
MKFATVAPPRLRTMEESDRTATWLELFYDLVFVAAVAMMGTRLVHDVTWSSIASYLGYFALVWWLWASHTFYADRYDTDDLIYRFLAGAQMVGVALIAVSVSLGVAGSTMVFALGYTAVRLILLVLYARAYRHVVETRELVRGYLIGFGAASALWLVSIVVPEPYRFWLWLVAFAVDLATPYILRRAQAAAPLDVSHLPERFGLFTILVLGESIVAVTVGLSHVSWQPSTTLVGVFGLGAATCLWWINFDNHEGSVVRRRGDRKNWRPTVWIYSHLPLAIALAMFGVSVELAIVSADAGHDYLGTDRWLLVGSVALALAAMAAIQTASVRSDQGQFHRSVIINRLLGIPLLLLVGLIPGIGAAWTMVLVTAVCSGEIVADLVAANT